MKTIISSFKLIITNIQKINKKINNDSLINKIVTSFKLRINNKKLLIFILKVKLKFK